VHVQADRRQTIIDALADAGEGDVVVVAGKGHEDYQEINGVRHPFSDLQVVRELTSGH
jgi:UDP-N-acetylmuramoyl-L-alanyl-D-glutamate--2,6-diaminopimelate ligase